MTFTKLAGGGAHTCGLTSDGSAWCWGSNTNGQLGDGSFTARNAPISVAISVKFASISAGFDHTCALTSAGAVWCWGMNNRGQLGDGTTTRRSTPVPLAGAEGVTFIQVAAGGAEFRGFTCALSDAGVAWCWGGNDRGQLGRGAKDFLTHPQPAAVSGDRTFSALVAGLGNHVCGLASDGTALCWGGNGNGALGDGTNVDSFLPLVVPGAPAFTQLAVGGYSEAGHACGLTSAGVAWCWGDDDAGAVGDGTMGGRRMSVAVAGGHRFASISAGFRHTCGRRIDGVVYCWGSGRVGQLGTTSTTSTATPLKVAGQP
jgi:alpha-tubulin suppressor-like RCC1 family protein